jgi:DNA-binding transcriptional LysR family regulator
MEAFVVVVDTVSFSAAARRLNVGQPAVSKLVAQLEERLGVKLLVRTTRGLTATEAGLNYYERAHRSIEEAPTKLNRLPRSFTVGSATSAVQA